MIFRVFRAHLTIQKLFLGVSLQHSCQIANLEEPIPLTGKYANLPAASGSELLQLRSLCLESSYSLTAHGTSHSDVTNISYISTLSSMKLAGNVFTLSLRQLSQFTMNEFSSTTL